MCQICAVLGLLTCLLVDARLPSFHSAVGGRVHGRQSIQQWVTEFMVSARGFTTCVL
jgi:hypothetical protein